MKLNLSILPAFLHCSKKSTLHASLHWLKHWLLGVPLSLLSKPSCITKAVWFLFYPFAISLIQAVTESWPDPDNPVLSMPEANYISWLWTSISTLCKIFTILKDLTWLPISSSTLINKKRLYISSVWLGSWVRNWNLMFGTKLTLKNTQSLILIWDKFHILSRFSFYYVKLYILIKLLDVPSL